MRQLTLKLKEKSKATESLIKQLDGVEKLVQVFPDYESDKELSLLYVVYVAPAVSDVGSLVKEVATLNNIEYVQEAPIKTCKR